MPSGRSGTGASTRRRVPRTVARNTEAVAAEWADAGHGPALLVRADGTTTALGSSDLPIGLQPVAVPRTVGALDLAPGDRLVLVTDGTLALDGIGDVQALAALAAAHPEDLVARIRSLVPAGGSAADVAVVVLTRT